MVSKVSSVEPTGQGRQPEVGQIPRAPMGADAFTPESNRLNSPSERDALLPTPSLDAQPPSMGAGLGLDATRVDMAADVDAGPPDALFNRQGDAYVTDMAVQMTEPDAAAAVPECPPQAGGQSCTFTQTSRSLVDSPFLRVVQGQRHRVPGTMTPLELEQLLVGFDCGGLFMPATPQAAFDMIDDDGVMLYTVEPLRAQERYSWFRFFMGDTEVGYIFREGGLRLVAIVSDQELTRCVVPAPQPFELSCAELDECLSRRCATGDVQCRRPCIQATEQQALEAYIIFDECRSDCGADNMACIERVCAADQRACFMP